MNRIQILQFVNHGSLAWLIESLGYDGVEVGKILLISPSHDDYFPRSRIFVSYVNNWDLNLAPPGSFPNVDLAISLSVMMYSSNPVLWISNILSISNPYIFQDLKYRKRSSGPCGLGADFDTIRYTCNSEAPVTQPTFVLSSIGDQLEQYFEFPGVGK